MKKPVIKIKQDAKEPIPTEIIAKSIVDISEGMKLITSGRLNKRAVMVLLKDASGVPFSEIQKVLAALEDLKATYVR